MPLFAAAPVADFSNRNLDSVVSEAVSRFGREHRDLLQGARLGVSLFDLSTAADDPPYGGLNDTSEFFVASLAKIGAMYAAYQLRSYLREEAADPDNSTKMPEELLPAVEKKLTPQVESLVPDVPKGHPDLSKIFAARYNFGGTGVVVSFSSTGENDNFLDQSHALEDPENPSPSAFPRTRALGFKERLELMIRWSGNCGACTCISDLGLQYINAALQKAGLFDARSSTGLWLGANYAGSCPGAPAGTRSAVGGGRVPVVNKSADNEVFQVATPRSVARLLRAIAELKLVDAESCGGLREMSMQDLLDKRSAWSQTSSPIGMGLNNPVKVYSKLGVGASTVCDCALILSGDRHSGPITYGAVVLGAPRMPGKSFDQVAKSISVLAPYLERPLLDSHR
jgi:beta-lactamase family protein